MSGDYPHVIPDDRRVEQAKRVRLPVRVIDACPRCGEVVERDMADNCLYYPEANGRALVSFYHLDGDDEHEWSVPVILRMALELVRDEPASSTEGGAS